MDLLNEMSSTMVATWIFSLLIGEPYTITKVFAVVLGVISYEFLKPIAIVMYKNSRKEEYHG